MMIFRFVLKPHIDAEEAWNTLTMLGAQLLYSSEDPSAGIEIYGHWPSGMTTQQFSEQAPYISEWMPVELPATDWQIQWSSHGFDFHDGYVHVPIQDKIVKLEPGPGFGDLSHATTRLLLDMLSQNLLNLTLLDVGCGSGILSLCAIAMGIPFAYGVDIDSEAIVHAKRNATLNGMEQQTFFCTTEEFVKLSIQKTLAVAMNMIRTEQEQAWDCLSTVHAQVKQCFTSGILLEERSLYLKLCQRWGWTLVQEIEKEGWLAFHFRCNH